MTGAYAAKRVLHRRTSLEAAALGIGCRVAVKNVIRAWALQPDLAWPLRSIDQIVGLLPSRPAASVEPLTLPNCPAELIHAPGTSGRNAILYLHGGAFLTCGLNTHRALAARLSAAADALVLNVGYRMLPACGLADAVEDALAGLSWLRRRGFGAEQTVIAGDSAGGISCVRDGAQVVGPRSASGSGPGRHLTAHRLGSSAEIGSPQHLSVFDVHRSGAVGLCPVRAA